MNVRIHIGRLCVPCLNACDAQRMLDRLRELLATTSPTASWATSIRECRVQADSRDPEAMACALARALRGSP